MKDTDTTTVRRNIALSKTLDKKVAAKAKDAGVTYPEYVRFLLLKDAEAPSVVISDDWGPVPDNIMDEWNKDTNEVLKQIFTGKIKGYDNADDLMKALEEDD